MSNDERRWWEDGMMGDVLWTVGLIVAGCVAVGLAIGAVSVWMVWL